MLLMCSVLVLVLILGCIGMSMCFFMRSRLFSLSFIVFLSFCSRFELRWLRLCLCRSFWLKFESVW